MFENVHRLEGLKVVCVVLCLLIIPNINMFFKVNKEYTHRRLIRDVCEEVGDKDAVFRVKEKRELSIVYPNGSCAYTPGNSFPSGVEHDGLLIAAYPASGVRLTWMHVEGLTEILVGDDFDCLGTEAAREGIIKTQYPHVEGLWSYADNMKDVALLIRNPRFAIPAYHTLISEIMYAHDCETAIANQESLFTHHPPVENWTKWRDYRFTEEMDLWRWHIDFWMENGTKYWQDLDFERNGQPPFEYIEEGNRGRDLNCIHQNVDCVPKIIMAYEYINDPVLGPPEVNKLAKLMEKSPAFNVIEESARPCIFESTLENSPFQTNIERVGDIGEYNFTYSQLLEMLDMINGVKAKYSAGTWDDIPVAGDLSLYLSLYAVDIGRAILDIEISQNYPPTTSPNGDYHGELQDWYKTIGRGDRYNKEKVMAMEGYWPKVAHLYDDDT